MPRALLSVYDKTGVVEFARGLVARGFDLLSSGGTARRLAESGVPVVDVAELTGFPPILGHRVVTLHPAVHGALLADWDDPEHVADAARHGIEPISLLAVDLYPFTANPSIELIDVGGPAMVRAAAKNHRHVAVVTSPTQYAEVLTALDSPGGVDAPMRARLAAAAFSVTAAYDAAVATWMADEPMPESTSVALQRIATLRYGENPHQSGALYRRVGTESWWARTTQVQGKELSYLNVLDADAAHVLAHRFTDPCAVVIKHANPCGLAVAGTIDDAYAHAHGADPLSAFGGIVGLNRPVDSALAARLVETFLEVVVAPAIDDDARGILARKPNLRVLEAPRPTLGGPVLREISGGLLVQDPDPVALDPSAWRVVSRRQPTETELRDAEVAWVLASAVWSNAVVLVAGRASVGIGGGQQNRLDAARLACERAGDRARGAVAASDAFFPFRDGPDMLAAAGVTAIVQPGGSQRDAESIAAVDEAGITMWFTGERHFRH